MWGSSPCESLPASSLMERFSGIKLALFLSLVVRLISYLNPPAMESLISTQGWRGQPISDGCVGRGEGGVGFLHSNEGSSPSSKALSLIFLDRQKYISLCLSISRLTLHSQAETGRGSGGDHQRLRNSLLSFSCKEPSDT